MRQMVCILALFLLAYTGNYYFTNVSSTIEQTAIKQLVIFIGISVLFCIFNRMIYHFAKKEKGFMVHRIWYKMYIIILLILMISFVLFIILFFGTSLQALINAHTWIMFLVVYYFLFWINLFVLSLIHILTEPTIKTERKLFFTWIGSSLLAGSVLFLFPAF
ncbi:hypothetical protein D3H55_14110 [Bacillus salacetis]|uniref:Uncharacterized protein n=1 Tax=Bacillus salacetis TaxID=2315464 RepID=A0A3A1QV14_9BACI|nr:hypothetical protein [Bacillus salacetis]RIW32010.1 hypothetical protein D3H55_14110 [Bacillus salacetis]